uniref:Transmembrane protein n=1 Tax=Solanum lycopersicum TaxID=4081 RepID=A0A3Q7JFE5_SOLLC
MAQNGKFLLAIAMIIVILFFSSTAVAQDTAVAPTPPMETGMDTGNNGFGLPVSKAMVCFSVIFSMLVVLFH